MLIAEDGTGLVDANALCSIDYADAYFADRVNTAWLNEFQDKREALLIEATDYIELRNAQRFKSQRLTTSQRLSFPRVDYPEVPDDIKRATCEYAAQLHAGKSLFNDIASTEQVNTRKRTRVGSVETEVETSYPTAQRKQSMFNTYPVADILVRRYVHGQSGGVIR